MSETLYSTAVRGYPATRLLNRRAGGEGEAPAVPQLEQIGSRLLNEIAGIGPPQESDGWRGLVGVRDHDSRSEPGATNDLPDGLIAPVIDAARRSDNLAVPPPLSRKNTPFVSG